MLLTFSRAYLCIFFDEVIVKIFLFLNSVVFLLLFWEHDFLDMSSSSDVACNYLQIAGTF